MILVADRIGQLGNRLFQFAHLIGFAADYGLRVANPGFQDYAADFPAFADDALCRWPAPRRPVPSAFRRGAQLQTAATLALLRRVPRPVGPLGLAMTGAGEEIALGESGLVERAGQGRLLVVAGWGFRDDAALARHAGMIRELFTPAPARMRAAAQAVAAARRDADLLVGLHIRRGDYAQYADGRYFWSAAQYAGIAEQVRRLESGRRVSVLACSDDREILDELSGIVTPGPGHLVEDLVALAGCDLVLGPPSTFSTWASFYGGVPLRHLQTPDEALRADEFAPFL